MQVNRHIASSTAPGYRIDAGIATDDEIGELAVAGPPATACGRMIDLAKARGGHDNISVGLFRVCAR